MTTDYTEIMDDEVRTVICDLMSEMLDHPDSNGIYPTSKFMWKMEKYICDERDKLIAKYRKMREERQLAFIERDRLIKAMKHVHEMLVTPRPVGSVTAACKYMSEVLSEDQL